MAERACWLPTFGLRQRSASKHELYELKMFKSQTIESVQSSFSGIHVIGRDNTADVRLAYEGRPHIIGIRTEIICLIGS